MTFMQYNQFPSVSQNLVCMAGKKKATAHAIAFKMK
jgi:hypothetical protein